LSFAIIPIYYIFIANSNGTLTTQAKLVTRKGISYMDVERSVVKLYVGDVQTDYTGLFDQNEVLGKNDQ
jgi:hypothetical protein